jgi:hypothetical protein
MPANLDRESGEPQRLARDLGRVAVLMLALESCFVSVGMGVDVVAVAVLVLVFDVLAVGVLVSCSIVVLGLLTVQRLVRVAFVHRWLISLS